MGPAYSLSMKRETDPIEAILGPIVDVTLDASAEIERRRHLGRLERENAIMKQAIRKSQHYLGRYLEPGNLSSTECINGLLKTLDNDEINEVTKR